jgi:membrane-bound lytic murein transglycosylase D
LLPVEVADTFSAALAELPADERLRWQRHKVKSGETLSEIAEQYHTTMASIRAANELTRDTIRAGSYLMIPVASRSLSSYSHSKEQRLARTRETDRGGRRIDHVVAAGESFWSIGQRYGVSARKLAAWNGVAPRDTLAIGQTLVVWAAADSPVRATQPVSATTRKLRYTVRNGDSLSLIASRFRVSVSDLVRWNNIDKNNILRPGQKLTMYVDVTRQSG